MFIGAMIDLGVDARKLERELRNLRLTGYHLHVARMSKSSIEGVKFDVHIEDENEHHHDAGEHHRSPEPAFGSHGGMLVNVPKGQLEVSVFETKVPPRFRLYFLNRKGKPVPPIGGNMVTLETLRPDGERKTFRFKKYPNYLEATEELPEPHEFQAILNLNQGGATERYSLEFRESHEHDHAHGTHEHTHSHSAEHSHGPESTHHHHEHSHGRNYAEIKELIRSSSLSEWVKQKAVAVFQHIARAEGKIHGVPADKVHFHEVGAVDSIVDIVGACIALELLGKPQVLASSVVEGTGFVNCAHGRFPIPAPATLEILGSKRIPISQCEEPQELLTPTGAALLAEFVEEFGPLRGMVAEKIGFGLGTRNNQTRPNVVRAILGTAEEPRRPDGNKHDWETDTITILEANLDDISGEILGNFVELALSKGALDVYYTSILMKKNRPGVLLTVMCAEDLADQLTQIMLRETSTFGVRRYLTERRKLLREFVMAKTDYGEVSVKIGKLDGQIIQCAPEFESCKLLAESKKVSIRQIYSAALKSCKKQ